MHHPTPAVVAFHTAGITAAFMAAQANDPNHDAHFEQISEALSGWIGIAEALADAAESLAILMTNEPNPDRLPFVYDLWDLVGESLWRHLPNHSATEAAAHAASAFTPNALHP